VLPCLQLTVLAGAPPGALVRVTPALLGAAPLRPSAVRPVWADPPLIRYGRWSLLSNWVVRRCIDWIGQEHRLRKEEAIAEEELLAEEGVEEGTSETRVSKKDVEAQVMTERHWPNK